MTTHEELYCVAVSKMFPGNSVGCFPRLLKLTLREMTNIALRGRTVRPSIGISR